MEFDILEYNAQTLGEIHSKLHIVDGVPILRIWSEENEDVEGPSMNIEFPILNLQYGFQHLPGRDAKKGWFFDGGVLEINDDDRGPDGRTIEIYFYDKNQKILIFFLPRRVVNKFEDTITRDYRAFTRKQIKEEKKQKGRNVAAFRQTMGNLRPKKENPVPEAFAAEDGPAAKILEFLTGKRGSSKSVSRSVKRQSVRVRPESTLLRNTLPNLVTNRGGRRTYKKRRQN